MDRQRRTRAVTAAQTQPAVGSNQPSGSGAGAVDSNVEATCPFCAYSFLPGENDHNKELHIAKCARLAGQRSASNVFCSRTEQDDGKSRGAVG